jgi:glycosyltransferase involved in cell wall biosynthesis
MAGTSCVIPAWNASATIARALKSVLATPGIAEVIVVDDGSTDDTAAQVERVAASATVPLLLIRQDNAGAGGARNTGMQAANLDWLTFLDADDEMLPEAVAGKAAHLATCPDPETVDAVHGSFLRGDTGATGQFAVTTHRVDPNGIGRAGHKSGFPGGVVSYVFRTKALQSTGGFRAELVMFEDFELILRFIACGARIVGCNEPGFRRNYIPNSLSRGTSLDRRLRIEREFLSIASRDQLMSSTQIIRRKFGNRARQLFHTITGSL